LKRKTLGRALELTPDDPEVNYSLGMLSAGKNNFDGPRTIEKR